MKAILIHKNIIIYIHITGSYKWNMITVLFQAYLEFFTSKENIKILKEVLTQYPQVNYHIIDSKV